MQPTINTLRGMQVGADLALHALEPQIANANALLAESADFMRQVERRNVRRAKTESEHGYYKKACQHQNKARTAANIAARIEKFIEETGQA